MRIIRQKHRQRGSAIVESMVCIMLLCLVFFALLQIWHWSLAKMICEFSSFYAAKGRALGYAYYPIEKASRARAIGVSGRDMIGAEPNISPSSNGYRKAMEDKIVDYMGDSSALSYEYWEDAPASSPYWSAHGYDTTASYDYAEAGEPLLRAEHYSEYSNGDAYAVGKVWLENMPLLDPWRRQGGRKVSGLSAFVQGAKSVDMAPDGKSRMFDYSQYYLEN